MKLIVGGYAQGKLGYVVDKFEIEHSLILDGVLPEVGRYEGRVVINHLNLFIKDVLDKGECPEEAIDEVVRHYPDCIIICDEVGNGIVPIKPFEREYRDRTGRILIQLAKQAEEVERVICGIGQKIK